ncbi:MAG: hypothetical protein CVU35_01515 [Betaproteobacteria bacterium HGW-Betaproteobacteria-8]|nr:MAG: hypothetical protein CVU35_01515 [Betaproteobacteria bacterium HGW-Betaproteobacteria-8]
MLNRIRLNHTGARRFENSLAYALLFMGIAIAVVLFIAMQTLNQQNAALIRNINQLQQPGAVNQKVNAVVSAGKQEEIAAVRNVMAELSMPWEPLFRALETLNIPDIKLVAVEPNPRQHKLRLTAEASDTGTMLLYVERMSRQPIFKDVLLLMHEQTTNGMMPIRFVVEAAWTS